MSTQAQAPAGEDGSEDVNDFLQRIKELGDRRDQEDEERNRKLEEEILQGRKERQARRAERARSISPTKSSPANTPTTSRVSAVQASALSQSLSSPITPHTDSDNHHETAMDAMEKLTGKPASPTKENSSFLDSERTAADTELDSKRNAPSMASPSNAMPSRSSQLSWQRRPNSQTSEQPRSRPLSMLATENAARSPRVTPTPEPSVSAIDTTLSRDQIAQSLASKDPSWFRQTADRGANPPAYRRQQVEDEDRSDHGSSSSRVQMPGMVRGASEPDTRSDEQADRSTSPSRSSTPYGSSSRASYQANSKLAGGLGSPMPLTPAQRFDPPGDSRSEGRALAMSPSQGRISPDRLDRPPSPTKGMGGFVQSAMMKRSDSVSKRWSVQSPAGLTRGNSVASNRSSHDLSSAIGLGGPLSASVRDNSPRPNSRPNSSHSNATVTQERPGTSSSIKSNTTTSTSNDGFIKPLLPPSRTQTPVGSMTDREASSGTPTRSNITPPTSPSKTMDARRWSPTKSSWLESALNKPDSPKPKAVPPPQQPAWMAEINKAKQKGSVDLGRSPTPGHKHEVSIGGLMRSPPPGGITKPLSIGGLPKGFSSGAVARGQTDSDTKHSFRASSKSVGSNDSKFSPPSMTAQPPLPGSNAKPETPPKKNFRANLKPRQPPPNTGGSAEPEFKNVFGQLRRTQTQNYVAPDELKDNITRGKAALNLTGGPKKTERKDEFKEAILKKKDDFKKAQLEGKGISRSTSGGSLDAPVPEALVRRRALTKSDSSDSQAGSTSSEYPLPRRPAADSSKPKPNLPIGESSAPGRIQSKEPTVGGKLAGRLNPGLAGLLARGPPSMASESSESSSPSTHRSFSTSTTITNAGTSEPGPQLTHMTKGRARGPRRKAPSSVPASATSTHISEESSAPSAPMESHDHSGSLPQVAQENNSNTKPGQTRDEAPPAKAPQDPVPLPVSPRKLDMKRRSQFLREAPSINTKAEPQLDSPKPLSPAKKANVHHETSLKTEVPKPEPQSTPISKPKPSTPVKSPSLSSKHFEAPTAALPSPFEFSDSPETLKLRPAPLSPSKSANVGPKTTAPSAVGPKQTPLETKEDSSRLANPETPKARPLPLSPSKFTTLNPVSTIATKLPAEEASAQEDAAGKASIRETVVSVKNAAAMWNRPTPEKGRDPSPRARSPIKLPTHEDEKAAMIGAGLRSASPTKNTGLLGDLGQPSKGSPSTSRPLPIPPVKSILSPRIDSEVTPSPSPTKSIYSPVSQTAEASRMLDEFFTNQAAPVDYRADTASILTARPDQGTNVKTLRASLCQLSSDGKKQAVPNHQERILFEGNMYLCIHSFGTSAGKKVTEVYFWIGDAVPSNSANNLEPFVQKEAKNAGGKLIIIRQGKETPEMFQALGGIIIIRRGSSNKYDSLASHILCARKHFGQIAFDEVDFSPASLCSGFPYLISTQSGKSYLWKGKGSGIDELSCARLIGMDFGLTGEVEEIEDGSEPESFLAIFGTGAKVPKSADHWRMKPNYNKHCTRLFCADPAARQQIVEINPFCQSDFDHSKVYILDAFFEIYIIVGSRAQSQYQSFHHALMFAQEYGILAAGMEDRPFVPVTTVVLEGVPKDMKSVFRKWDDKQSPTFHEPKPLQRGRSLRVVPLTAALEATRK